MSEPTEPTPEDEPIDIEGVKALLDHPLFEGMDNKTDYDGVEAEAIKRRSEYKKAYKKMDGAWEVNDLEAQVGNRRSPKRLWKIFTSSLWAGVMEGAAKGHYKNNESAYQTMAVWEAAMAGHPTSFGLQGKDADLPPDDRITNFKRDVETDIARIPTYHEESDEQRAKNFKRQARWGIASMPVTLEPDYKKRQTSMDKLESTTTEEVNALPTTAERSMLDHSETFRQQVETDLAKLPLTSEPIRR